MKTILNSKRNFLYLFLILGLAFFIVGSIVDLQISQGMFSKNNIACLIFASIGALPAYGGLAFLCGALVAYAFKFGKETWRKVLAIIIALIGLAAGIYFQGKDFGAPDALGALNATLTKLSILFGVILVLPFTIPGFLLCKKNSEKKVFPVIIVAIAIIVIPCLLSFFIKLVDHRPRFRFLVEQDDMSLFRNWWQSLSNYMEYTKAGVAKDEFASFPSMHTSCSFMIVVLAYYLPNFVPSLRGKEKIMATISVIFPIGIAFTRVIVGAHFVSDTAFSFTIAAIFMVVGDIILNKINMKKESNKIPSTN